jgi:hypothetical protein
MNRYSLYCINVRVSRKIMIAALLFLVCCFSYEPIAHATIPTGKSDLIQSTASGHILGFEAQRMYVASGDHVLRVEFAGTDGVSPVADQMPTGDGHAVPLSRVNYPELWPGISLSYEAISGGIFRSSYLLKPGADVSQIRLRYNTSVEIESGGGLRIDYKSGWMNESAPVAWQEINGKRIPVTVAFSFYDSAIINSTVGFSIGQYNPAYPLMIDPTLSWNTFMGGADEDGASAISIDDNGNVYVAGYSYSTWGSPLNGYIGNSDGFVAKLNNSGVLQWNTFMGGAGSDFARTISIDGSGNLYVVGSSNMTWGSPLNAYAGGGSDAFVAKLNGSGVLQWNTFMGGSSNDSANAISIDINGNLYVVGNSYATWGSSLNAFTGASDAFVARLNSSGVLQWNTFMGGVNNDNANAISMDGSENVYVVGESWATWGAPLNAYTGGLNDGFVAKLNNSGVLQWNTFIGGVSCDWARAITMDSSRNIYITGESWATWGAPLNTFAGGESDGFIAKLNSSGVLQWNTFIGGADSDVATAISINSSGNLYVAGESSATWGEPLNAFATSSEGFVAKLNGSGVLQWNTFMGGIGSDWVDAISMDSSENVYVAGYSYRSWGIPLNAHDGEGDAFVAKLQVIVNGEEFPWELFYPAFMKHNR